MDGLRSSAPTHLEEVLPIPCAFVVQPVALVHVAVGVCVCPEAVLLPLLELACRRRGQGAVNMK